MIYAERVTVSPENITLKPGEWYYGARAEVRQSYATCDCVYCRSSDPSVASVNKETGYIYARSAGHAVITAEAADGGGASDCFTVTVTTGEIPVWTLTLNYHDIKIKKGATFGLNVSIDPWNATNKKLRWSSSNTSIATVNGSGVVTGISAGKATITVEPIDGSECCDMCTVTVEDNAHITSVTVSPSRLDLAIGEFTYLHAEVCPCDGKDRCVTWSSEDQSIVAVNPDSGFIIARGSGTVKVYATATDGSGARGCCTVTVAAPISVTGIEVSPTSLTRHVCESATLKANVLPCNATNKLVTWSSSDDSVVKVVDIYNGGILAKGVGSATLTATTADGGLKGYCTVTVKLPFSVTGIRVSPATLRINVGVRKTLNAEIFPYNAVNKNVTWRSSNENVVEIIDARGGIIIATGVGSATVTATTADGGYKDYCSVTVDPPVAVTGVKVRPSMLKLNVGVSKKLSAEIFPSNAANKNVTWSSNNESVVTVTDVRNGTIFANGVGSAVVTAATADGGFTSVCMVEVKHFDYRTALREYCGFSYEAAELILRVYKKMDVILSSESKMERDWTCARLLSEFCYDYKSKVANIVDINQWDKVAGSVTDLDNRQSYFINTLGFTEDEYDVINDAIIDNHNNSGNVEGRIDFAHLQYSLAARLAYKLDKDNPLPDIGMGKYTHNYRIYSDEEVSYFGGWLGDAVLVLGDATTTSFGNNDYMADLDAENIFRMILQGYNSVSAFNKYYYDATDNNTRADVFLRHIPYDTAKAMVLSELLHLGLDPTYDGEIENEDECWRKIRSEYPDTYNFLKSLADHRSEIVNYI